ncbi:hypothetical protein Pint_15015 [Pistacia integerrima]|uniref:Uncharacterized protein n=1 Tax=Pistacia integerrima TaxID=434235 RepID=A0ACC0ZBJ7_9ROSI|nr:hypothetical protein Pint_15015 [Pistacia integerrima]
METQQVQHMQQTQPNVAIVPTPGMAPKKGASVSAQLHFHNLSSPANFDDLPEDVKIETRISLSLVRSLSALRETLKVLTESTKLAALVADVFGTDALEVAKEFGILSFIFFPSNALVLSFVLHLPELDKKVTCEFRDLPEPLQLPGCVPIHGRDLADSVQDKKSETYKWLLGVAKQYHHFAAGIMVNSFMDLELGAFKALMEDDRSGFRPPVYPVGPLIQNAFINEAEHEQSDCLKWLDEQPSGSVLFISFGSGGTLSQEQLNELALGLEMSGQRFLWPLLFCGQPRENLRVRVSRPGCTDMEKPIATLDKDTTCSSWNYCGQRLATGSVDGTLSIFDSRDPASSSFTCSSRTKVYDGGIIKVVWVPPEYGDAIACICIDGSLLLWEEVVEDAQPLQWKLCKSFKTNSALPLDVQFGVSSTSLKMVAAYSDGHVRVYELPDPLELKNWQLQAEFQNVIESLATFARASCLSASISWNPLKGENQESSFVLGFNSNTPQLNSSKVC